MKNNNFGSALMTFSVKATVTSEAKEIATKAQDLTSHLAGVERLLDEWGSKTKDAGILRLLGVIRAQRITVEGVTSALLDL